MTPRCYNKATLLSWKIDSFPKWVPPFNVLRTCTYTAGFGKNPESLIGEIKSYLKVISSKSLLKDIFWSAEDRREQGGMMLMQNNDAGEWGAT